jgi:hypothetical protein
MRSFLLSFILLSCFFTANADEVSMTMAKNLAANFYRIQNGSAPQQVTILKTETYNETPLYYIFQINNADGFVIVSADDQAYPILGYDLNGEFIIDNMAPQVASWLDKYKNEIIYIINHDSPASEEISQAWIEFKSTETPTNVMRSSVGPLVNVGWDQAPFYNASCPFNTQYNDRTVTGCVATAMAIIMKYWSYPSQGSGFHSYNTQTYGTLSADFGNTTYNWAAMPNSINSNNNEIARLMAHLGVSVEMTYGVAQTGGSGAYVANAASPVQHCSEYAYKTYFGYDATSVSGVLRSAYTDQAWINLLKSELDASRPMQYAGIGDGGGHTWVCDGYDNNNFFHMNWGWSNQNNGFFNVDALNPQALGTGGGSGGFNGNQHVVKGIKPPGGVNPPPPADLSINSFIYVNPTIPIDFNSAFNVTCQINNNGNTNITADFAAVLVTPEGYVVDFVETFTNQTLNANANINAQFSTTGSLATPGTYYLAIIFKQGSGNWQLIQPANSFFNPVTVEIAGPYNTIQLYSAMTLTPAQFVSGQSASVNVNLINEGFNDWLGTYYANLYDLDGNFVTTIGSLNENQGLPYTYSYLSPYLNFSTDNLNVPPGTYILAMTGQENGEQEYLLGGTYFTNPLTITVVAPPLNPDQYEANNTTNTAFNFTPTFAGNNANVLTTGSNIHLGSDVDYYKLNLASGYNYIITARVHDSESSGNGNTYTIDAVFSYDAGSGPSLAIDDIAPDVISLNNGGNILFKVSPIFTGNTGTYLLDLQISRTALSIEHVEQNELVIYPNPSKEIVWIASTSSFENGNIELINNLGQVVARESVNKTTTKVSFNTIGLNAGIYFVKYTTQNKSFTKTIAIQ